jgi:hypothetical protein
MQHSGSDIGRSIEIYPALAVSLDRASGTS